MINETLSLDSTLESPTKPHQPKASDNKKAIFLVHYNNFNQELEAKKEEINENCIEKNILESNNIKASKRGRKPKKISVKKSENNILDYDLILNICFPKKKEEKPFPPKKKNCTGKKFSKKMIGYKRKRQIKEITNKSKYFFI